MRHRSLLLRLCAIVLIACPADAVLALSPGDFRRSCQRSYYERCRNDHPGVVGALDCFASKLLVDPPANGITSLTFSVQYDPSKVAFDPSASGPLGVFSLGGDAPLATPGIGTEPLRLLPDTGFSPGAPLPGSSLTYTVANGILTVNYDLASPISTDGDVNVFILGFTFLQSIRVDVGSSTVTYLPASPGSDFTQLGLSCTTADNRNSCGSSHPATGITVNQVSAVPEPATWTIMVIGFGLVWGAMRNSRRRTTRSVPVTYAPAA